MTISLRQVLDRLEEHGILRSPTGAEVDSIQVAGVTTDSRQVAEGTLFCAVRGSASDGHGFLESAAAGGAVAALVEEPNPAVAFPQVVVSSGRSAAAHAGALFYGDPWSELKLIGVTGTNGKTTTVSILRHLLAGTLPAASIGTLGVIGPDGKPVPGTEGLTTPGPIQFAREMRALADSGVRGVAMEVSSHALDQERVGAARFAAAIFTNLSRDHLDYHGTVEAYRAAKLKLADLVSRSGVLAVNADEPAWEGVKREGVHLVRFGTEGRGEVQAENIRYTPGGAEWYLATPSCSSPITAPLLGSYNVYNALGAAAALWGLGWTADQIADRLASIDQIPGRLERIVTDSGAPILIDYAHTPDALDRALDAVRPFTRGRLIVVFGAGGDRDRGKRPEMGRVAAAKADLAIVTSDNPRTEDPASIIDAIEDGMGSAQRERILDRREAIAHAIDIAGEEDVILLAGKGHETYQIRGTESHPFDERQIIAEILEQRKAQS